MAAKKTAEPFVLPDAVLGAYAINNRINVYLVENLSDEVWRAKLPDGKGRDIASIVSHMHNVRGMWLKAVGAPAIEKLEPSKVTRKQAVDALNESWQALENVLRTALKGDGRVKGFKPDVAAFFGYLVAHDAHHRGQICMLARQTGHPLPQSVIFGMWEWGSR